MYNLSTSHGSARLPVKDISDGPKAVFTPRTNLLELRNTCDETYKQSIM